MLVCGPVISLVLFAVLPTQFFGYNKNPVNTGIGLRGLYLYLMQKLTGNRSVPGMNAKRMQVKK